MTQAVTAVLTTVLGLTLLGALILIGGFLISMAAAMLVVPIASIRHHRHHPLAS